MEIAESDVQLDEVIALYSAVAWTAYTRDADALARALAGSHLVLTARDDGALVGLVRTVSDAATICYVQDLLVHPAAQRRGIGRALLRNVLDRYAGCRQLVLVTDADGPDAFYRALGLVPVGDLGLAGYARP